MQVPLHQVELVIPEALVVKHQVTLREQAQQIEVAVVAVAVVHLLLYQKQEVQLVVLELL
jgi:hypothetical protein